MVTCGIIGGILIIMDQNYNDPYYSRNRYSGVAYMNGQRSSLYSTDKGILENSSNSNSTTNYNVGRNENKIEKSGNGEKSEKLDQIKNRNINRVYYALKNSQGVVGPARGYQNRGELENYGNFNSDNKRSSKPNFQTTKYGSTRSYDVSRSSKGSLNNGRGYSRSELNNTNSSSNTRAIQDLNQVLQVQINLDLLIHLHHLQTLQDQVLEV